MNSQVFIVNNIKLPINASQQEAFSVSKKKLCAIGADVSSAKFKIYRRSTDARKKENIYFVYSVAVSDVNCNADESALSKHGITL